MQRWQLGFATLGAVMLALVAELTVAAHGMAAASEPVLAESGDVRALVAPVALYPDPILAVVLQASTLPLQVVQTDRFLTKREKDKTLAPDPDWDKSIIALLNYPRQVRLMSEYIDWTEELGDRVVDDLDAVQAAVQDVRLAAYDAGFLKSDKHQEVELKDDKVRITLTDPQTVRIPRYDPAALLTALDEIEEADESADEVAGSRGGPGAPPTQSSAPATQSAAPAQLSTVPPAEKSAPPAAAPATVPPQAPAVAPVTSPVIVYGEPENTFWSNAASFAGGAVVGGLLGWGLTEAFDDDDDHDHSWDEDDWDNEDVEEALREGREFRDERRDDVLAARNQRLETRQGMAAQRQANRNAMRTEREGDLDQQQGARQAERDQGQAERQGGREERRAEREAGRAARGESREERATRAREQLNEVPEAIGGLTKPVAAESPPPRREQGGAQRGARDIKLPDAGTQARPADTARQRSAARGATQPAGKSAASSEARLTPARQQRAAARAGYTRPNAGQGMAAGVGNRREVRAEANRGVQSRGAVPRATEAGQRRAAPVASGRGGGGGGTMLAQAPQRFDAGGGGGFAADRSRGFAARADSDRGRMSRAAAGGGGRRGR
jgi:uncharacterized protein DUF3300